MSDRIVGSLYMHDLILRAYRHRRAWRSEIRAWRFESPCLASITVFFLLRCNSVLADYTRNNEIAVHSLKGHISVYKYRCPHSPPGHDHSSILAALHSKYKTHTPIHVNKARPRV